MTAAKASTRQPNAVTGKSTHDARLAALMVERGIPGLLTFNDSHFARYTEAKSLSAGLSRQFLNQPANVTSAGHDLQGTLISIDRCIMKTSLAAKIPQFDFKKPIQRALGSRLPSVVRQTQIWPPRRPRPALKLDRPREHGRTRYSKPYRAKPSPLG
jgi:hypothetical protein